MKTATLMLAVVVALTLGCTPWRVTYLREVTNKVTQDEIAQKLGPPHRTRLLGNGNTLWQYEYRGANWCREYILTFDQQKVLRNWSRQKC